MADLLRTLVFVVAMLVIHDATPEPYRLRVLGAVVAIILCRDKA